MGVSTNAILFYGYCWDDEAELIPEDVDGEWSELVLRKRGVVNPWDACPKDLDECLPGETYRQKEARGRAWRDVHRAELDAWCQAKQDVEAEFGVELGRHCSNECPMPYLAIAGSVNCARRGYPERLEVWPETKPEWDGMLDRWLSELGIERPHAKPGWFLVSYWG